jgi:predicted Zn-dependent protease
MTLCCGCVTIYNPATERKETYFIDTKQEIALGRDMDAELHKKLTLVKDPLMQRRLDSIGQRVATYSDRLDLMYTFAIVKDKELNAFAIPGGFIYVNSGLMDQANDDELAGVLAHEIAHIAARHSVKKLQSVLGYQIIMGIILGTAGSSSVNQAIDVVFSLVSLGYSRQDETLADKLAVRYTRRANFDPRGIISFFRKLQADSQRSGRPAQNEFLSSHPDIENRIRFVEEQLSLYPY